MCHDQNLAYSTYSSINIKNGHTPVQNRSEGFRFSSARDSSKIHDAMDGHTPFIDVFEAHVAISSPPAGIPGAAPTLLLQNAVHSAWRRARHWEGSIQLLADMQDAGENPQNFCCLGSHIFIFSH